MILKKDGNELIFKMLHNFCWVVGIVNLTIKSQ